ncbi:MAG: type II toxin-antitoxin system VapC family toxin [Sulfuritalea sp.]|nr:type II toxin-antitoxin system VapC family toxin [Sulfuritalea sp.]
MTRVLDASAVLALLKREPGHERVAALMASGDCVVCAVNWAETASKLADSGHPSPAIESTLAALNATIIPFDTIHAVACGLLRPATRHLSLSLGDRACLALAKLTKATVITADRPWLQLAAPLGLTIECIRPTP